MSDEKTRVGLGLVLGRGLSLQLHDNNTRPNKINGGARNGQRTKGQEVDWGGSGLEGFWGFKGGRLAVLLVFIKEERWGIS